MGKGACFVCPKCRTRFSACLGIGMTFPSVYRETLDDCREGKYGDTIKELLEQEPDAAIDAEEYIYQCGSCNHWEVAPGLSVYIPNWEYAMRTGNGPTETPAEPVCEYVTPWELKTDYHILRKHIHICPECGKRMHRVTETDCPLELPCPKCGTQVTGEGILWD